MEGKPEASLKLRAVRHAINKLKTQVFSKYELRDVEFKYRRRDRDEHFKVFSTGGNAMKSWKEYWYFLKNEEIDKILAMINDVPDINMPLAHAAIEDELMKEFRNDLYVINQRIEEEISKLEAKGQYVTMNADKIKGSSRKLRKEVSPLLPYSRLFRNREIGNKLKIMLKNKGYLNCDDEWTGVIGTKSERYALFNALDEKGWILGNNYTTRISCFFKEFKVELSRNEIRHAQEEGAGKRCRQEMDLMIVRLENEVNNSIKL